MLAGEGKGYWAIWLSELWRTQNSHFNIRQTRIICI